MVVWANDLKNTWVGDANLDGKCDSSDLVLAFKAGEYEDEIVWNSTWSKEIGVATSSLTVATL